MEDALNFFKPVSEVSNGGNVELTNFMGAYNYGNYLNPYEQKYAEYTAKADVDITKYYAKKDIDYRFERLRL